MRAMANKQPPKWRPLSELPAELNDLRTSLPAEGELEGAIANSLRSNLVPIRGRPFNKAHPDYDVRTARPASAFQPLAGHMGADTNIKLAGDFVSIRRGAMAGRYLRVEADLTAVREWLRKNALPSKAAAALSRKRLPDARLPELERFLLDFDRKQEIAGESRGEDAAWRAAQERFPDHIITRDMVRDARKAAGCIGKPGKKSIHAAK
jgi:hypothetical protein